MIAKHAKPIVVRFWLDGYDHESTNVFVHDWQDGKFSLDSEHPLVQRLYHHILKADCILTCISTEELEWAVDRADCKFSGVTRFTCVPRREHLRRRHMSDEYLIETGQVS